MRNVKFYEKFTPISPFSLWIPPEIQQSESKNLNEYIDKIFVTVK